MAISQTKYINIVSAAAGGAQVSQRDLIGRIFTSNYLVPANQVVEFSGGASAALESVADFFGTTSQEYKFAEKYFQVNAKNAMAPKKISFARYTNTAMAATLIGARNASTLSQLQALTAGTLSIVVNGVEKSDLTINLSGATSLADVASSITAVIDNGATCTYDAVNARFVLQTNDTGADQTLGFATGTIATALGWTESVAILSDGADATTPVDAVINSAKVSNNFFSFCFLGTTPTEDELVSVAQWVRTQNVRYMFSIPVTATNAESVANKVAGFDGTAVTLDLFDEMAMFMPMSRIAAIDWTQPNAVISMNFQQFDSITPSVQDDITASKYDALRVNYYGSTQQAGQTLSWYQPGVLMGTFHEMGVFAAEAWLKDSIFTNVLNVRLGLNSLPANDTGTSLVLAAISQTITEALYNGTILPGKTLGNTEKASILQITGNPDAWQSVQSAGYYLTADLQKYVENGITKYKVSYLLVYSKGDSINYVDGRDILI